MNIEIVILVTMQMTSPLTLLVNTTEVLATEVLANLSSLTQKLFTWFANNKMKANHDKCHLLLSTQENFNVVIITVQKFQ